MPQYEDTKSCTALLVTQMCTLAPVYGFRCCDF